MVILRQRLDMLELYEKEDGVQFGAHVHVVNIHVYGFLFYET